MAKVIIEMCDSDDMETVNMSMLFDPPAERGEVPTPAQSMAMRVLEAAKGGGIGEVIDIDGKRKEPTP